MEAASVIGLMRRGQHPVKELWIGRSGGRPGAPWRQADVSASVRSLVFSSRFACHPSETRVTSVGAFATYRPTWLIHLVVALAVPPVFFLRRVRPVV